MGYYNPNEGRSKRFVQLAPVVMNDGVRDVCILYALDALGQAWVRTAEQDWLPVEQPPASTRDAFANTTKGVKS